MFVVSLMCGRCRRWTVHQEPFSAAVKRLLLRQPRSEVRCTECGERQAHRRR